MRIFQRLVMLFIVFVAFLTSAAMALPPSASAAGNEKSKDPLATYCAKHSKIPKAAKSGCTNQTAITTVRKAAAWHCRDYSANNPAGADCVIRWGKKIIDDAAQDKPSSPSSLISTLNRKAEADAKSVGGNSKNAPPEFGSPVAAGQKDVDECIKTFFGLKPWYAYLDHSFVTNIPDKHDNPCDVECFNVFSVKYANPCGGKNSDVPAVMLAILDDMLRIAGIVAVAFVFVGAFQYAYSQGEPDKTAAAQSSIVNALIGLAIAITAVAFVNFIGARLGG